MAAPTVSGVVPYRTFFGTSRDTKPEQAWPGEHFYETDTHRRLVWAGLQWVLDPAFTDSASNDREIIDMLGELLVTNNRILNMMIKSYNEDNGESVEKGDLD